MNSLTQQKLYVQIGSFFFFLFFSIYIIIIIKSVNKLFGLLEIYQRASGAKVNLQKTQGVLMGKLRYEKDTP